MVVIEAITILAIEHIVVFHHKGDKEREDRRLQYVDKKILFVGNLGQYVAGDKDPELLEPRRYLLGYRQHLVDVVYPRKFDALFEILVPLSR